jgi:hypothetical protein
MTFDEAKEGLRFHCGSHPDVEDPRWEQGFLQSLRPYRGLDQAAYEDLTACIEAVSDHLQNSGALDRDVINSLWGICHFARAWAIAEDGMLRQNALITPADQEKLDGWITSISYQIAMWLDGNNP